MLPDAFADAFSYGSAALVIGSGIASARPFSAPSWRSVVSTTLDGVATGLLLKVSDRDLSERLSQTIQSLRAHSVHTEHIIGAMIETVGVERAAQMAAIASPEPNAHHLSLAHCVRTLNIPVTITVDFGNAYERALERVGVAYQRITRDDEIAQYLQHQLGAQGHLVVKIAGALDDTRSLREAFGDDVPAATATNSRRRTLSQARQNLLESLPSTYRVLALGVDNYDPYAADVVATLLRGANPDRVAIQAAPTDQALTRLISAERLQATRLAVPVGEVIAWLVEIAAASTPDENPPDLSGQIGQPLEFVARLLERMGDFEAAHSFFTAIFKNGSPQVAVDISSSTLITIGQLAQRHGDLDSALSHYDSALAAAERSNDPHGVAQALMHRGRACRAKRDHEGALKSFALALDLSLEHEFDNIRADALHELAEVHERQGDLTRSIVRIRQLADLYERRGDRQNLGRVMLRLGNDLRRTGELQHAAETFDYVLALADEAADRTLAAWADCHLVDTKLAEGLWPHDEQLRRSLVVFEVSGERKGVAFASINLARLCALLGDLAQARQYLDRALRTSQETLDSAAMCSAYVELAQIDALLGDRAATALLERGVGLARELDDKSLARRVFLTAGFALLHLRELEKVGPVLGEARVLATVDGDEVMEALVLHGLGMRSGLARDVATAERRFRRASELFNRLQMPVGEASAREWLAHTLAISARREEAQQQLEVAAELVRNADDRERATALAAYATRLLEDAPIHVPVVPIVIGRHLRHLHIVPAQEATPDPKGSSNTGLSGVTAFALSTPTSMVPVAPVMSANEGDYRERGEAYAVPLDSEAALDSSSIHDAATFASDSTGDLVPIAAAPDDPASDGGRAPSDVPSDLRGDNSVTGLGAAYVSDEHATPRAADPLTPERAPTAGESAFPIVPMDTAENAAIEAAARDAVHDRTQVHHASDIEQKTHASDRSRFVASHEALSDGDAEDAAAQIPTKPALTPTPSSMSPPSLAAVPSSGSPSSSSLVSEAERGATAATDRPDDLTGSRRFEVTGVKSSSTSGRRKAPVVPREGDGEHRAPSSAEVAATRPASSPSVSAAHPSDDPPSNDPRAASTPSAPVFDGQNRRDETLEVPIRFDISTGAWADALDAMPTLGSRDAPAMHPGFDPNEMAIAPTLPDIPSVTELSAMDDEPSAGDASGLPAAWASTPGTALPVTPAPEEPIFEEPRDPSESDIFGHESVTNASTGSIETIPVTDSSNRMPSLGAPSAPVAVPKNLALPDAAAFAAVTVDAMQPSPPPLPVPASAFLGETGGGNGRRDAAHDADRDQSHALRRMVEPSDEVPTVRPSQTTLPMPDFADSQPHIAVSTVPPMRAVDTTPDRPTNRKSTAAALPAPAVVAGAASAPAVAPAPLPVPSFPAAPTFPAKAAGSATAAASGKSASSRAPSPNTTLAAPPARATPPAVTHGTATRGPAAQSTPHSARGPAPQNGPAATPESQAPSQADKPSPKSAAHQGNLGPDTQALPASLSTRTNPPKGLLPPPPRTRA